MEATMFGTAQCPHCGYKPSLFLELRCYNCGKYTITPGNWKLALWVLGLGWGGFALAALLCSMFGK